MVSDWWNGLSHWASVWITLFAIFLFVVLFVTVMWWITKDAITESQALGVCIRNGYPQAVRGVSTEPWYCVRRVNGNDEVVPVCRFVAGGCE